ncbi:MULTISPECIES: hypothetical protein [Snodgrassella]|uniref:hypothetical protein n=1 Tax=Snodgrassella TaxID=1193515 RepID=UPI000A0658E1|nr:MULTISPECIES: hypothetical protein [Snodgrassella]MBI0098318.1 hypothetical protein [Snodgrassella sp. W8134]MBI0102109.1 hypothetical protein [Snodgrassella sp. W8135]ORF03854.1 hypothetical protein BGH97_01965 [Snodgrassella alvi]ORF09108.1 hypothetical protein BGH99_03520 [Snodgrassella alvi]ORF15113.1 hypothetical protein BGI00_01235 [Snodgrassella alvi]
MENIDKNLSIIRLLETTLSNKVSAEADKIVQESMEERLLRMKTVNVDKAFNALLNDQKILDVFIRLRDK